MVGLGYVLNGEDAQRAIDAGAKFISSPFTSSEITSLAKNCGALVMQGVATPTEAWEAQQLGADIARVFPAELLGGPVFVKLLRNTFPHLKMVAHGNVTLDNILDYVKTGATAVAIWGTLIEKSWVRYHDWEAIAERAKHFVEKIESLKVIR